VECAVLAEWLTAEGYEPISRFTVPSAEKEMHTHQFDVLVADARFVLRDGLRRGRALSNFGTPVVVVGNGEDPLEDATSGQALYLRRPVDRTTFICYVSMMILEGRPTRCSVRKAVDRLDVLVNGMPVRLLDVSNEGLRVAMSAGQSTSLPVYFNVRIPFVGVSVTAQRKWGRLPEANAAETWYGGGLSQNRATAEYAWRKFVDIVPSFRPPSYR
jgi:hypothetical protein